ncbi:MAG: TIGR04168 family protein [Cyanobacteria bacterium P01_A01_bin.123]
MNPSPSQANPVLKIAVVGDVHDQWGADDAIALDHLNPDLVLFVGDFGNESVEITGAIAALDRPKAVILGNHDAWYSATHWGREKCPYDRSQEDWVQQQLDLLGITHVGYGKLDFPDLGLSVVGGRPFSWGGPEWRNKTFYRERYGIHNFEESTARICEAIDQTRQNTLVFIGHCGPQGLGKTPEDPCGRDWKPLGGDWGEPDLTNAIAYARQLGKQIPLVTFGHMHHGLRHRKDCLRKRWDVDDTGTLYLNAASVPRIMQTVTGTQRNFSLVTLDCHQVRDAALVWVNPHRPSVQAERLYSASPLSASTA